MTTLADIDFCQKALISSIRSYVQSQVKDWQLVPWLALDAYGRGGWVGYYRTCFERGLWLICAPNTGVDIYVDCLSGNIVTKSLALAADGHLMYLMHRLDVLDAKGVTKRLREEVSSEPPVPTSISQQEFDHIREAGKKWRAAAAKKLGLEPIYDHRLEVSLEGPSRW